VAPGQDEGEVVEGVADRERRLHIGEASVERVIGIGCGCRCRCRSIVLRNDPFGDKIAHLNVVN
jgi:hypothetical protein